MRRLLVGFIGLAIVAAVVAFFAFSSAPPRSASEPEASASSKAAEPPAAPAHAAGDAQPDAARPGANPAAEVAQAAAGGETARESADVVASAAEPRTEGTVEGLVLDFDGQPASGVKIRILPKKGFSMLPPDAETDGSGRFVAKIPVKKKKTMRLRASRKDRIPITVAEVEIRRDEKTDLGTLQFAPSGMLDVRVSDSSQRAIPNAQVTVDLPKSKQLVESERLERVNAGMQAEAIESAAELVRGMRTTDESGLAAFAALPVGRFTVNVETRRGMGDGGGRRRGGDRNRSGGDDHAEPASDTAQVSESKSVEIVAGKRETIEVSLRGLGVLTGRALLHGQPLAEEWMGLFESSTSGSFLRKFGSHVRARTDANGRFTFAPVPPGAFVVSRGDPGEPFDMSAVGNMADDMMEASTKLAARMFSTGGAGALDHARSVDVREGQNSIEIDFGGTLLEVAVQDADDGRPVANATVRLFDKPKDEPASGARRRPRPFEGFMPRTDGERQVRLKAQADGNGRASFQDLQPGSYRLIARVADRPPSLAADTSIGAGGSARVVLRVPKASTVRGTVNDRSGNAIDGATVTVLPSRDVEPAFPDDFSFMLGPPRPRTTSDSKGAFLLKELESGAQKIVAFSQGYAPAVLDVTAPSEGWNFFLEKPGRVRVTVRRAGQPAAGVHVSLKLDDKDAPLPSDIWNDMGMFIALGPSVGSLFGATTDDSGVATIGAVPPGEWTIEAGGFGPSVNVSGGASQRRVSVGVTIRADDKPAEAPKPAKGGSTKARALADQEVTATIDLE